MDHLLPWLQSYKDNDSTAVVTVFVLEHVLLLTIFGLRILLDKEPKWIGIYLSRRAYKQEREQAQEIKKLQR